ncbi:hypothetical protein [Pseudomonas sp. 273]|uniref:hypothetical protein n=1 Tax=Pseudomonas sp. 273 TaxID=75692 RepID=UPI0023D80F21|nr:hypothetical protein [Pseudomonas sp. 273]
MGARPLALLLGVGLGLLLLGLWQPSLLAAASLPAALAGLQLPLGGLLLAAVLPLVHGAWQGQLAPGAHLALRLLPWALPFWLPVLLGAGTLHPQAGGFWLSPLALLLRALAYALLWWLLARRQGDGRAHPGALMLLVLLATLLALDWVMALSGGLHSALLGLLLLARQWLDALALASLLALARPSANPQLLRVLLCASLGLWAYLHYMQFLVIDWARIPWSAAGTQCAAPWQPLTLALFVGHGLLLALLASPLGRHPGTLRGAAWGLLLLALPEAQWLVLPSLPEDQGLHVLPLAWLLQAGQAALLLFAIDFLARGARP